MGDRLVTLIKDKNDKILAGSYQHWSAGDAENLHDILDRKFSEEQKKASDKFTVENAVNVLVEMLAEYNGGTLGKGGLTFPNTVLYNPEKRRHDKYISLKQKVFNEVHKHIPIGSDRTDGFITVDEKIADYWADCADDVNVICVE